MPGTLVICRNRAGLPRLHRLGLVAPVTVASDDPHVQYAAASLPGVVAVRFIEQNDSFYTVAAEVVRVLGEINDWLASFSYAADGLEAETLEWGRNVEGGRTTQRVQDALLLIRFYRGLLRESGASEVHLIAEPAAVWDDLVLTTVARAAGIPLVRHAGQPFALWRETLWTRLRPHAIACYYFINVLRLRRGRPAADLARTATILFQLGSSLRKHVDNIAPLMLALQKRGERPAALCWSASERYTREPAPAQLAARGLTTIGLERWLSFAELVTGFRLAGRLRRCIARAARTPGPWQELQHDGIPLAPLLEESLYHFLIAELPQRLRYQRALVAALAGAQPAAFKPWAGPESFEGRTARRLLATRRPAPLVFHYWLGASLEWPYADPRHAPDLFLAAGPHEARLARLDYALTETQVEITGQARYAGYTEFSASTSATESRRVLRLPPGRCYAGFDPSGAVRGYLSVREQTDLIHALLRAAGRDPGLVVVIKPHPSYPIDHLQPHFAAVALPNVVVLDRAAPLFHFLNATDLVIVKYSTLILEAALMGRPAISVLLDGEDRFKVYGDMPEVVRSAAGLESLLLRLSGDHAVFQSWREARLMRQKKILPEYYFVPPADPAEIAADTLCARLR